MVWFVPGWYSTKVTCLRGCTFWIHSIQPMGLMSEIRAAGTSNCKRIIYNAVVYCACLDSHNHEYWQLLWTKHTMVSSHPRGINFRNNHTNTQNYQQRSDVFRRIQHTSPNLSRNIYKDRRQKMMHIQRHTFKCVSIFVHHCFTVSKMFCRLHACIKSWHKQSIQLNIFSSLGHIIIHIISQNSLQIDNWISSIVVNQFRCYMHFRKLDKFHFHVNSEYEVLMLGRIRRRIRICSIIF